MLPISERFEEAVGFALRLHREQARKGSRIPYVAHLLSVAALAMEHGADEDEAIAALLHDAVEDQGGLPTLEAIRETFGERVANLVAGCTDSYAQPKPPWRARKETYLAHLREADASIRLISACDKLHNARAILSDYLTLGPRVFERFKGGRDGTLWYYRSLADIFAQTGPHPLSSELERVVRELERVADKAA